MSMPLAHHLQRRLGHADGAHAVVDAARAETALRDLEAAAFAQQDVLDRHANVVEHDLGVAEGRVVHAEQLHVAHDGHAGRVLRHQDHRLLFVAVGVVGVGLAHEHEDFAALVHGAGDVPLAAVDDVFVAFAADAAADVGGVARGDLGLGHRERGTDFAREQRLQPALLLGLGAVARQHFHVAGVGCGAVEYLGAPVAPAHDLAQRRVFDVGQARAVFGLGQEQVPQPALARLGLEAGHHRQFGIRAARACIGGQLFLAALFVRIDELVHELEQLVAQRDHLGCEFEMHGASFNKVRSKLSGAPGFARSFARQPRGAAVTCVPAAGRRENGGP